MSDQQPPRRRYDSPLRRQRAAETREQIISAGAEFVHEQPFSNWHALNARAVANRAGVNERTVYRHFTTERALRDAVFYRLQEEAGILTLDGMKLEDVADVTERTLTYVSSFPQTPQTPEDATFAEADRFRREALLTAVRQAAGDWPETDQAGAAAMLDVLWNPPTFERLATVWGIDPQQAVKVITWVVGLVETAVHEGRRP